MFARQKSLVGLDIGSTAVKVVELRPLPGGGCDLSSFGTEPLPPDAVVEGTIIAKIPVADAIVRLFDAKRIKNRRIATSLSGHSVIVKKITVPLQSRKELDESIQWEAAQYIPFEIADVHLDYHVLSENSATGSMEIILVAAKKEKIIDQTSVVSMAGKLPTVVDVDAFALQNAYELNYAPQADQVAALLDIGASTMSLSVVRGNEFLFTRDITIGTHHYIDFLQKEMRVTGETAERLQRGEFESPAEQRQAEAVIATVSEILALEIHKTLDYFKTLSSTFDVQSLYVSGGGSHVPGLLDHCRRKLQLPVEIFDAFRAVKRLPPGVSRSYLEAVAPDMAIAVGLALRSVGEASAR